MQGLRMQKPHALLGCRHPEHCRMSGLGALTVRTHRLTERAYVAEHVQQVVLDLEGKTDRVDEPLERLVKAALECGHAGRRHEDAGADQGAGLARMHLL